MFSKILVPLDGSALSEQALPMAQHLARSSDTSLHRFKRFFLGSVTDRVIRAGQTPVLVLPAS